MPWIQLIMEEKQEYRWTNREDFPPPVQALADPILSPQGQDQQQKTVRKLFQRVLQRSESAVLRLDDKTGEMELYELPRKSFLMTVGSTCLQANKYFSSSRSFFNYRMKAGHWLGGRGSLLGLSAYRSSSTLDYGLQFEKWVGQRIDNYLCTTRDRLSFFWALTRGKYYDSLIIRILRDSNRNYLKPIDSCAASFSSGEQDVDALKHSNQLCLMLSYDLNRLINLQSNAGFDYGNKSYFFNYCGKIKRTLRLGSNYDLKFHLQGGRVHGNKVLKHNLLFRNQRAWVGRSDNFLSARMELAYKQYPYLPFLNITPYLYAQGWAVFRREERHLAAKIQAQYGFGFATSQNARLDINLFRVSGDKVANRPIGEIKFSF